MPALATFLVLYFIAEVASSCIEKSFTNAEVTVCAERCIQQQKVEGCVNSEAFEGNVVEVYLNTNVRKFRKSAFMNMPDLKGIYATNVGLEIVFPGAFANLPELEVVDLSLNYIEDIVADVFNVLDLESINLSFNNISYIDRGAFSGMPNLRMVLLNRNSLNEFKPEWFINSTSIENVNLAYNNISSLQAWAFDSLPNLAHLDVSFNRIAQIGFGLFTNVKQLQFLDFTGNNLTEINPNIFYKGLIVNELRIALNRLSVLSEQLFSDGNIHAVSLHENPWNCLSLKNVMRWTKLYGFTVLEPRIDDRIRYVNNKPVCVCPAEFDPMQCAL